MLGTTTDGRRLDAVVAEQGFATLPLIDAAEVAHLRVMFDALDVPHEVERWASAPDCEPEVAFAVDRAVRDRLAPVLAPVFPGFTPFLGTFFAKGANGDARVEFHQDWTHTDERTHRAILMWLPLIDVGPGNGTMEVVPGSHRWSDGIRASHETGILGTIVHRDALAARAITIELRAGEALFFDPALCHATTANPTPDMRPAVGIVLAPPGSELLHFRFHDDGRMRGYRIPPDRFYLDAFQGRLDGLDEVDPWTGRADVGDFVPHLA